MTKRVDGNVLCLLDLLERMGNDKIAKRVYGKSFSRSTTIEVDWFNK